MAEVKYKNGKPEINAYELPIVPVMVHPQYTEDWHYNEQMLHELTAIHPTRASTVWAIQMIAELQALWIDATDRLQKIEELARR
jgi:hypothetical protein